MARGRPAFGKVFHLPNPVTKGLSGYVRAELANIAAEEYPVNTGEKWTWARKLGLSLFQRAIDGDNHAAKIVVEQLDGKPSQRIEIEGAVDLGALLQAAAGRARNEGANT